MRAMSTRVSSTQMARLLPTKQLIATQNLILFSPGGFPGEIFESILSMLSGTFSVLRIYSKRIAM